ITGVGRKQMTDDDYRNFAKDGVAQFSRRPLDARAWETFAPSLFFANAWIDEDSSLASLGSRLDVIEHERELPGNRMYYLAVPPSLFAPTVKQLHQAGFVAKNKANTG